MSREAYLSCGRKVSTAWLCLPGPRAGWKMLWSSASHSWSAKSTCREFDLHQSQAVDTNTIPCVFGSFLSDCVHGEMRCWMGRGVWNTVLCGLGNLVDFRWKELLYDIIHYLLYAAMVSKPLSSLQFP